MQTLIRISHFALTLVLVILLLSGCTGGATYYASYHPTDYNTLLVLLPTGAGEKPVGKLLDEFSDPPFRIATIPEAECAYRGEAGNSYLLIHRVNPEVAKSMAKLVSATLVIYQDEEVKSRSMGTTPPPRTLSDDDQIAQGRPGSNNMGTNVSSSDAPMSSTAIRLAVYDVKRDVIIWHESLSPSPSVGELEDFIKRLTTSYEPPVKNK